MSCGSPMPRGERIAKPAEWGTHAAGLFLEAWRRSASLAGQAYRARWARLSVPRVSAHNEGAHRETQLAEG